MTFVRMVEVTIVQVVCVAAVKYGGVSTTWPMLMRMVGMGWGGASRHEIAFLSRFQLGRCRTTSFARRCLWIDSW
jgi:hypothetical protein